jgi:hypothetical protein
MPNDVGKFHFLSLPFTQTANELSISITKFFFKRDSASLDLQREAGTPDCDFDSAATNLIENAITENAMHKLKVFAISVLFQNLRDGLQQ